MLGRVQARRCAVKYTKASEDRPAKVPAQSLDIIPIKHLLNEMEYRLLTRRQCLRSLMLLELNELQSRSKIQWKAFPESGGCYNGKARAKP